MHHKFLVFAEREIVRDAALCGDDPGGPCNFDHCDSGAFIWNDNQGPHFERGDSGPHSHIKTVQRGVMVWTGSYNFTQNAERSWENAVIIRDPVIADAYLREWAQLYSLSEPLDWKSPYVAPEWRIGT